jgi:hypothetical protein
MLVPLNFRTATPDGEAEGADSGQHQPQLEDSEGSFVCATLLLVRRPYSASQPDRMTKHSD